MAPWQEIEINWKCENEVKMKEYGGVGTYHGVHKLLDEASVITKFLSWLVWKFWDTNGNISVCLLQRNVDLLDKLLHLES